MSLRSITLVCGVMLLALFTFESQAIAHQSSYTYGSMSMSASGNHVNYEIRLSSKDLFEALQLGEDRDATDVEILAGSDTLLRYVFGRVQLFAPGQECERDEGLVQVVMDGQRFAQVQMTLRCPSKITSVELVYDLFFDLDKRHEGLLRVGAGVDAIHRQQETLHTYLGTLWSRNEPRVSTFGCTTRPLRS